MDYHNLARQAEGLAEDRDMNTIEAAERIADSASVDPGEIKSRLSNR